MDVCGSSNRRIQRIKLMCLWQTISFKKKKKTTHKAELAVFLSGKDLERLQGIHKSSVKNEPSNPRAASWQEQPGIICLN